MAKKPVNKYSPTAGTRAPILPKAKPVQVAKPVAPKPVPKPVVKRPPLPGAKNWAQAAEYGWTGSADPNVVTRATLPIDGGPESAAPSYAGVGGMDWGPIEPYAGPSSSLLTSQQTEDLGQMSSGMTSKIRQALVDLGLTDTAQLSEGARGYVDEATLTAAGQNKYSLFNQIAQKAAKQNAQARARLAARGMLSSGQLTKETKDVMEEAEQGRYAGVREFTGGVGDLLSQYAQRQREWAQRIAEARFQEAQYAQYAAQYGGGGGGGGGGGDGWTGPVGLAARPGEWADLPMRMGWDPSRNSDAEYDMSGATPVPGGYIGPQGQRYDEKGRVI